MVEKRRQRGKRLTPGDDRWFALFLCSRWGKFLSEIESMPISEFSQHKQFWQNNRWGMTDDLQAIQIVNFMRSKSSKIKVQPWQVKQWTTQKGYTYRMTHLIIKPAAAIRSGFMSILNAIKGSKNG